VGSSPAGGTNTKGKYTMFYKDNWMTWYYDGVERGSKTRPDSKYELKFTPTIKQPVKSYKEELLANACALRDKFNEPFDLCLSGGVDSEVILRCYHELGIPINVNIFRYENNINRQECSQALKICNELNVTPKIIDFNLQKFFENDAYDIWKIGYFASAGRLIHLKFIEHLDNIPILGDGDPYWSCIDGTWCFELEERCHAVTVYSNTIGRSVIGDWYEYSPKIILSHLQSPIVNKMINNKLSTLNCNEVKYFLNKSIWPTIDIRKKQSGWEIDSIESIPAVMEEFNQQYTTGMKFNKYKFTQDELINLLCGD
jgi:hypothetical protein